jgi:hypothetical protein
MPDLRVLSADNHFQFHNFLVGFVEPAGDIILAGSPPSLCMCATFNTLATVESEVMIVQCCRL